MILCSLSRLIEADYNSGATVYDYGYDVAGNLVNYDGVNRTYNAANQMTHDGTNTLTYDNNGNLRTVGSDTYTWDRANRLLSVGNHSYVYDGLGNRVQQTVSSVVTDYLNDVQPGLTKLLKQTTGASVEQFVHAPRGIHAIDNGTDWNFYAQDGLGSVRAVVDDSAVVQTSMSFDPYGNPLASYGEGFGFTGEQTDENGSVFLRARYYEPSLGTFSALDAMEGKSCTPMSLNRYGYVHSNPVNLVDPTGLQAEGALGAVCLALSAGDGPFPFGDVACALLLLSAGASMLYGAYVLGQNASQIGHNNYSPSRNNFGEALRNFGDMCVSGLQALGTAMNSSGSGCMDPFSHAWNPNCEFAYGGEYIEDFSLQNNVNSTTMNSSLVDYNALANDNSLPRKFPNQQCSEKLRLQLQDEIDNQACNQARLCTDLNLTCAEIIVRAGIGDACLWSREQMKEKCFPNDTSHDNEIDAVERVRDRCYQEIRDRC